MEQFEKQRLVDGVMTGLLMMGCPVDLGIPAWTLQDMVRRPEFSEAPEKIFGIGAEPFSDNMVDEYFDKRGYEFSWGSLSESVGQDEYDEDETVVGRFEMLPKDVLMKFPQPAMVEDLFMWMYDHHPLKHSRFDVDESFGEWFVMSFAAYGDDNIAALRQWLALTFVPKIMPDLVSEAMLIVTREILQASDQDVASGEIFKEKGRYQLCGDPAELSFNSRKN